MPTQVMKWGIFLTQMLHHVALIQMPKWTLKNLAVYPLFEGLMMRKSSPRPRQSLNKLILVLMADILM